MKDFKTYFYDEETGMSIDENGHTHFNENPLENNQTNGIELHHAFELMKKAIAEYQKKKNGHFITDCSFNWPI